MTDIVSRNAAGAVAASAKSSPFCEICSYGPSHRQLHMIQCRECNIHVHVECYFADFVDGAKFIDQSKKFTCIACQSVGRKVQAVETHWSKDYQMIKQKKRPLQCEFCSISDKVTAMHPIYEYHGTSGRQMCLKKADGKYRLAWGHTLCCLYLTRNGFAYGLGVNGEFVEHDEGSVIEEEAIGADPREPNPTSIITESFKAQVPNVFSVTSYRYYAPTKEKRKPKDLGCVRKAVHEHKNSLKCLHCRSDDTDPNCLRIPLQCVAASDYEFDWYASGRIQKKGILHPDLKDRTCVRAIHVGCARWGQPNPNNIQRVHWYYNNDNEACLYCPTHADDVGIKLPIICQELLNDTAEKGVTAKATSNKDKEQLKKAFEAPVANSKQKKKGQDKKGVTTSTSKLMKDQEKRKEAPVAETYHVPRKTSISNVSPDAPKPIKRKSVDDSATVLTSLSIPRKKNQKVIDTSSNTQSTDDVGRTSLPPPIPRRRHQWGFKPPRDRYAELDSSTAVAVNAGDRPTLKNNRRELAEQKSKVTDAKVEMVLDDLLKKVPDPSDKEAAKGRKLFWKRQFSELTKDDFIQIFEEATQKYMATKRGKEPPSAQLKTSSSNLTGSQAVVDIVDSDEEPVHQQPQKGLVEQGRHGEGENENAQNEAETVEEPKRYQDKWSHLFVGPTYRMGNEFTLEDFEEYV